MSVNSKMTAIANAIRSLLGITGSLGLDAMATKLNGITKKAAQTYTPGKNGQTIAAGQYLTGAQTIAGDANLLPENIAEGVSIFGVVGALAAGGGETVSGVFTAKSGAASVKIPALIGKENVFLMFTGYIEDLSVTGTGALTPCVCRLAGEEGVHLLYGASTWGNEMNYKNPYASTWDSTTGTMTLAGTTKYVLCEGDYFYVGW